MSSAEEFSSNESGWTKYLGSPSQEGNYSSGVYDEDEDEEEDECNYYNNRYSVASRRGSGKHKDSDNDSIASDASSGPSHHEVFAARTQSIGEKPCSQVKGKASKEPVIDQKSKKGTSLKQKRGKKAN